MFYLKTAETVELNINMVLYNEIPSINYLGSNLKLY